jgi:hypothetical protein
MTDENMAAQVIASLRFLNDTQYSLETLLKIINTARNNPLYDPDLPVEAQRQPSPISQPPPG